MMRLLQIVAVVVVMAIMATAVLLTPKFRNMKSEYGTAHAISDLKEYVQQHDGKWPSSPEDLGGKYPIGGEVRVNYLVTSDRLIGNQTLLRDAVRPRSGRFYTFPHYDEMINDLHAAILEANQRILELPPAR